MEEVKQSVNCDFTNVMAIKSTIKKGKEELEDIFHSLIEDFKCTTCLPDQFYISLFFRTFGVPWSNEFLWARFDEEGNPKVRNSSKVHGNDHNQIDKGSITPLFERAISVVKDTDDSYILFYPEAIIDIIMYSKYAVIRGIMTNYEPEDVQYIFNDIKPWSENIETSKFLMAVYKSNTGIYTREETLEKIDVDIERNYNDDIPYYKMKSVLEDKGKALILLYGEPGTGKSTMIKKFISDVKKRFIIMDPSIISTVSDDVFVSFLAEMKDSVIILEDCEKLLKSREDSASRSIGTVLNLTDGIVGDVFGIKFICTFNSDVKDIDKALLRKGRLSMKYEFKKLSVDKAKKIYPKADAEMTLADAYFAENENDFSKEEKRSIGF